MHDVTVGKAADVAKGVKQKLANLPDSGGPSSVRRSVSITSIATAMAKAQAELKNPPKDSINPHFKSKYADLATVRDAVIPVFVKHGLAVLQLPCEMDEAPALTTLLTHTSGEWIETTIKLRPSKTDPQGVGSALTYARRYALQSIAGVAAEDDDDGHAASQPAKQAAPAAKPASGVNPLVSNILALVRGARSREDGLAAWTQFEAVARTLTPAERETCKAAFAELKERFPAPANAKL